MFLTGAGETSKAQPTGSPGRSVRRQASRPGSRRAAAGGRRGGTIGRRLARFCRRAGHPGPAKVSSTTQIFFSGPARPETRAARRRRCAAVLESRDLPGKSTYRRGEARAKRPTRAERQEKLDGRRPLRRGGAGGGLVWRGHRRSPPSYSTTRIDRQLRRR